MSRTWPHPSLAALERIDWDTTGSIIRGCSPLFDAVAEDPTILRKLIASVADDPTLAGMCEGYDFLHKLVLRDAPHVGVRVRLHLYRPGFFDRPHNHRWSFASRILCGSYTHKIFGSDTQFDQETDPDTLRPIHERIEGPGSAYALHHSSVHTVQAQADTVSLLVRGPAAKRRFLILDASSRSPFWVYGAADETPEQRAQKRLSPSQLAGTIARVNELLTAPPVTTPIQPPPTESRAP